MSKYRTYSHRQKSEWDMDDEDGITIKEQKALADRRKEKQLKNILKSKKYDWLLEEDDNDV